MTSLLDLFMCKYTYINPPNVVSFLANRLTKNFYVMFTVQLLPLLCCEMGSLKLKQMQMKSCLWSHHMHGSDCFNPNPSPKSSNSSSP